jgi:hypothetical protein
MSAGVKQKNGCARPGNLAKDVEPEFEPCLKVAGKFYVQQPGVAVQWANTYVYELALVPAENSLCFLKSSVGVL